MPTLDRWNEDRLRNRLFCTIARGVQKLEQDAKPMQLWRVQVVFLDDDERGKVVTILPLGQALDVIANYQIVDADARDLKPTRAVHVQVFEGPCIDCPTGVAHTMEK